MPELPLTFTFGKILVVPGNSFYGAVEVAFYGGLPLSIGAIRGWEVEIVTINDPIEAEVLKYEFNKESNKQRITFEYVEIGDAVMVALNSADYVLFVLNLNHYVGWKIGQRIRQLVKTPLYFAREDSFGVPNVIWKGASLGDKDCPQAGRFHIEMPPNGVGLDKVVSIWKCTRDFNCPWEQVV